MLISKFDLYKSEWLELVFDDRNKSYGAYELRQHYSRTMVIAMAIAFFTMGAVAIIVGIIIRPIVVPVDQYHFTTVPLINIVHPAVVTPPKPVTHRPSAPAIAPAAPSSITHRLVPMVAAPDPVAVEPPKAATLTTGAIGPQNVVVPGGAASTTAGPGGEGVAAGPPSAGTGTEVYQPEGLERMPEPFGGASAWSKFLQKNLKYPDMAIDQHMQGRVWVSFIVEKNGQLSNIVVESGIGYGMDQEALRVLKLAPAWKPGIQNGQPVRVKYNIPINFQLGDE